jgi:hypothetical protein
MTTLLVRRIDGRLTIELPDTLINQAQLREGDVLDAVDIHAGGFNLRAVPEATARQFRMGLALMEQHAETYEVLAAVEHVMAEHEWVLKELGR